MRPAHPSSLHSWQVASAEHRRVSLPLNSRATSADRRAGPTGRQGLRQFHMPRSRNVQASGRMQSAPHHGDRFPSAG